MSALAPNSTPVQLEATRFRSAVSEATIQGMGGNINFLLMNILPVGSIIASMLTEVQFQSLAGTGWVLADARSCAGSAYDLLTGNDFVPDARGIFLRGKNHARSTATGNSGGDKALGTFEDSANKAHTHGISPGATLLTENGGPIVKDEGSEYLLTAINSTSSAGGAESNPRNITVNHFIRID